MLVDSCRPCMAAGWRLAWRLVRRLAWGGGERWLGRGWRGRLMQGASRGWAGACVMMRTAWGSAVAGG